MRFLVLVAILLCSGSAWAAEGIQLAGPGTCVVGPGCPMPTTQVGPNGQTISPSYPQPTVAQAGTSMTYTASAAFSAGTTSSTVFTALQFPHVIVACTLPASTTNVWLNLTGGAAVVGQGQQILKGGGCVAIGTAALPMPTSAITAITDNASAQSVSYVGG